MRYLVLLVSLMSLLRWGAAVHAAEPLPAPSGPVVLTISGDIEQTNTPSEAHFDREMLEALGRKSFSTRSALAERPQLFEGIPLKAVLDRVGAKGGTIRASALNDYSINIPWEDLRFDPLLATHVDGQLLKLRDRGPLWIVYPRDAYPVLQAQNYDSRWVWQLKRLHIERP